MKTILLSFVVISIMSLLISCGSDVQKDADRLCDCYKAASEAMNDDVRYTEKMKECKDIAAELKKKYEGNDSKMVKLTEASMECFNDQKEKNQYSAAIDSETLCDCMRETSDLTKKMILEEKPELEEEIILKGNQCKAMIESFKEKYKSNPETLEMIQKSYDNCVEKLNAEIEELVQDTLTK